MTSLCVRAALPILQEMRFNNIILGSLTSVFRYGVPAGGSVILVQRFLLTLQCVL